MKHPLFSENMEGRLSRFLLKFSESKGWLLFGFSALFIFIVASQSPNFMAFLNGHWFGKSLEVYCVTGAILAWLAAQAHTYKNRNYKSMVVIIVLWPVSFVYLLYVQFSIYKKFKNT